MSKCMNAVRKVRFYELLANVIIDPDLTRSEVERLMAAYREVRNCVSVELTEELVFAAHREYHSTDVIYTDHVENLARAAFADLARHFRWPAARHVFQRFAEISGTAGDDDLYASVIASRDLDEEGRFAVVTLIVDSKEGFSALFNKARSPSYAHLV